jgi:hypothetical protein
MKHIKRFSETQKVNEEIAGTLMIGGLLLALGSTAIIKTAKAAWTKMLMEMKYKKTGKEEMVPTLQKDGKQGQVLFEQFKDNSSGELFWGCTFSPNAYKADTGHTDEQYLLFDDAGYKRVKEELSKGDFSLSGSSARWSKKPGTATDGTESF